MNDVLLGDEILRKVLHPGDIILLDRGFRDCLDNLKNTYNLEPKMPVCVEKGQKQLTTLQANQSRMITKCRWVIEVTNSFLKISFRALDKVRNKCLSHTLTDYRIAASLINRFFKRLYSDQDDKQKIINNMKVKLHLENS